MGFIKGHLNSPCYKSRLCRILAMCVKISNSVLSGGDVLGGGGMREGRHNKTLLHSGTCYLKVGNHCSVVIYIRITY